MPRAQSAIRRGSGKLHPILTCHPCSDLWVNVGKVADLPEPLKAGWQPAPRIANSAIGKQMDRTRSCSTLGLASAGPLGDGAVSGGVIVWRRAPVVAIADPQQGKQPVCLDVVTAGAGDSDFAMRAFLG